MSVVARPTTSFPTGKTYHIVSNVVIGLCC